MSTAFFRFGPVRQDVGEKHLRTGDLVEAINVRQTKKAGVYAKRKGFDRTAMTFSGGSLSGTPVSAIVGKNGATLMRDSGDQLWARQAVGSQWFSGGRQSRPWVDVQQVTSVLDDSYAPPGLAYYGFQYAAPTPTVCVVGSDLWTLALRTNVYDVRITDSDGTPKTIKVSNTATGITYAAMVYAGGFVWVLFADGTNAVKCHKIDPANPAGAPVATTFYTWTGSYSSSNTFQVAATYMPSLGAGAAFVVMTAKVTGSYTASRQAIAHATLNTATGTGASANLSVATTASAFDCMDGLCILSGQDGSGTYLYYAVAGDLDATGYNSTFLVRVQASNFATWSSFILRQVVSSSSAGEWFKILAGFVDDAGNQIVVDTAYKYILNGTSGRWGIGSSDAGHDSYVSMRTPAGVISTSSTFGSLQASWLASGFAKSNGRWYFITGYDDANWFGPTLFGPSSNSTQRCYHLREFLTGSTADTCQANILAQFAVGDASAAFGYPDQYSVHYGATAQPTIACPLVALSPSKLACAIVLGDLGRGTVNVAVATVDTAKAYGPDCLAMGRAFSPGPIPVVWSERDQAHEAAVLINPGWIYQSGGSSAYATTCAAVYAIYDSDGTVWRSAPIVLNASILSGATIRIANPVFKLRGTLVQIEVYIGNGTAPKLQGSITPTAGQYYSTWTCSSALIAGETLYTTGNALSPAWPVACQAVASWRNRVFLASKNVIWTSREIEPGFGPLWNESMQTRWTEEANEITAMNPVDWNYLAVFSDSQPAVISGEGPDGLGNGNFKIMTLSARMGVLKGGVAQQGPGGCYFQDSNTGRLIVITPGLQVTECAGGAYDYAGTALNAAAWYDAENLMVFVSSSGKSAIVVDYQHTNEAAPFGQCYLWTFTTLAGAAVGIDSSGLFIVDGAGDVYRPGATFHDSKSGGTDLYKMRVRSGQLQFGDLQGEMSISRVQALVTMQSACNVKITTYPGYASATLPDARVTSKTFSLTPVNAGDAATVSRRPEKCARIQGLSVAVEEDTAVDAQSFEFEGFAVEYTSSGRLMQPPSGRAS